MLKAIQHILFKIFIGEWPTIPVLCCFVCGDALRLTDKDYQDSLGNNICPSCYMGEKQND